MSLRKKLALMLANLKKKRPFYCELEYLEADGTQYIDTGFKMSNDNMTFNGNIMWTQSNGNANFFYGYRSVDSAEYRGDMRAFFVYGASAPPAGRLAIRYGVNIDNSTSTISQNQKYNISFDGTNLKVDGTTFINLSEAYTPANYQNMYLFWCNCTGYYSADVAKFSGRIYNWQIKQDGVLVRDFIPVLDWDMTPCMYDRVTGQLFYNQGTGTFQYGREIHYVEYLESTGEQYIDTKYIPNINTECSMNLAFVSLDSTYRTPFSVRTADGATNSFTIMSSRSLNDNNSFAFGSNYWSGLSVPKVVLNKVVEAVLRKGYASWDGVSGNPGTSITPTTLTAYMFARNANGTAANFFIGRIYDCQLKENDTLARDFYPAIDENGVGFMFDKVTHTCFLNQGTGTFKTPPVELEYIESTGTQYIDTGISAKSTLKTDIHFEVVDKTQGGHIFGGRTVTSGGRGYGVYLPTSGGIGFDYETRLTSNVSTTNGYKYRVVKDGASNTLYVNGVQSYTGNNTTATFNLNVKMALFYMKDSNTSFNASVKCKVFYFKIYDNGTLVRDLVPTFKDGQAGMWDKANNVFYSNAGSGTFSVGKVVESRWE